MRPDKHLPRMKPCTIPLANMSDMMMVVPSTRILRKVISRSSSAACAAFISIAKKSICIAILRNSILDTITASAWLSTMANVRACRKECGRQASHVSGTSLNRISNSSETVSALAQKKKQKHRNTLTLAIREIVERPSRNRMTLFMPLAFQVIRHVVLRARARAISASRNTKTYPLYVDQQFPSGAQVEVRMSLEEARNSSQSP